MPPMASSAKITKYISTKTNPAIQTDATHGFFCLGLVGLLLGFFWAASSGLLLLLLLLVFGVLLLLATGSAAGVRLATALPLLFTIFYGGGGFFFPAARTPSPADESLRTRPALCYCQRGVGVSAARSSLLWRGAACAIQCRVAQGTGSLEHPCLAGVIPCCCPKRAHLIAARSATCGRWSGGCLIERHRQALRFPVRACRLPRPPLGGVLLGAAGRLRARSG